MERRTVEKDDRKRVRKRTGHMEEVEGKGGIILDRQVNVQ